MGCDGVKLPYSMFTASNMCDGSGECFLAENEAKKHDFARLMSEVDRSPDRPPGLAFEGQEFGDLEASAGRYEAIWRRLSRKRRNEATG